MLFFPVFLSSSVSSPLSVGLSLFPLLSPVLLSLLSPQLFHLSASLPSLATKDLFFPSLFRSIALPSAALPFSSLITPRVLPLASFLFSSLHLPVLYRCLSLVASSFGSHTSFFLARSFVRSIVYTSLFLSLSYLFFSFFLLFLFHSHCYSLFFFFPIFDFISS